MTTTDSNARIELVDDAHPAWPQVLNFIDRTGQRQQLRLMDSRFLPARQAVLAAFDGQQVVGHLSFHLEPVSRRHVTVEVDSCAIAEGYENTSISQQLRDAAILRAQEIQADPAGLQCGG